MSLGVLLICVLTVMCAAMAEGIQVTVVDADGREAVMTAFDIDGEAAWWAELPEGSALDHLRLQAEDETLIPGTAFSAPDAGDTASGAAFVRVFAGEGENGPLQSARLYVSHQPYQPLPEQAFRSVRAVGQWGRASGTAILLTAPDGVRVGTIENGTRVYVLYTCRMRGVEYACVQAAGEVCYIASSSLRMLTSATSLAFDATLLSERCATEDVFFARTAYPANMRSALGNSSDAVVETAPAGTMVIVLTRVVFERTQYDLAYRPDTGMIGFIHDTQLTALPDDEAAAMLAGEGQEAAAPGAGQLVRETRMLRFPASDAEPVAVLPAGTALTLYTLIDAPEGAYWLAQADDRLGYIAASNVGETSLTNDTAELTAPAVTAALDDALYSDTWVLNVREALLYAEPEYSAAALARAEADTVLTCVERREGWLFVRTQDVAGWIPEAFAVHQRLGQSTEDVH